MPRRLLLIELHPSGPRVWVLGARVHHAPPALLAAAALLLVAWHDRHDFPWGVRDAPAAVPPPSWWSRDLGEMCHPDDVARPGW